MWVTRSAYADSRSCARASTSASPPTITDSLPLRAPSTPPDTGASRKPMPRAASRPAASRAVSRDTVEWSMTSAPGANTPARPSTHCSTSASRDTHSTTASHSAKSAGPRAARTPSAAANASALVWVRLPTAAHRTLACRWPAIGAPMAPKPMKPTREMAFISDSVRGFFEIGVTGQAGLERGQGGGGTGRVQSGVFDQMPVARAQLVQPVADVVEHDVGAVALALALDAAAAER